MAGLIPGVLLLIVLLAGPVAAGGVPGAQEQERAVGVYRGFAEALAAGRFEEARGLAAAEALAAVERRQRQAGGVAAPPLVDSIVMELSRRGNEDGTVTVHGAHMVVPGGTPPPPPRFHRQEVILKRYGERWKVVRFHDTMEECCQ